jgi:predicted choloylglycine hydrolase
MHEVNLSGSYYEIGEVFGRILKMNGFRLPVRHRRNWDLVSECREITESVFPEIIDEVRGLSDGSGISFDPLCDFVLTHPQAIRGPGCTGFVICEDGETWIGRNYDWYYWVMEGAGSFLTEPVGAYKSLGQSEVLVGREDGVNEHGLGVALFGIPSGFRAGVMFWISIRYILDKCRSVDEAVAFLEETPHHCAFNVLLADPSGRMAVVEVNPVMTRVRWAEDNFIVSTNHLNHPDMRRFTVFEAPDSIVRYAKCMEELSKMCGVSEKSIQGVLSDHEGLVCSHIENMGLGTVWSTVTHLNSLCVWRAVGHPCSNPYVEDNRLRV